MEIPALFEAPHTIVDVLLIVLVASLVTEPDLVALVEKAGGECIKPHNSAISTTMMEVDGVLSGMLGFLKLTLTILTRDTDDCDQPAIFGLNLVRLPVKSRCCLNVGWVVGFVCRLS